MHTTRGFALTLATHSRHDSDRTMTDAARSRKKRIMRRRSGPHSSS
jgi:hypothetical protein